jgi:hypothetical protein
MCQENRGKAGGNHMCSMLTAKLLLTLVNGSLHSQLLGASGRHLLEGSILNGAPDTGTCNQQQQQQGTAHAMKSDG